MWSRKFFCLPALTSLYNPPLLRLLSGEHRRLFFLDYVEDVYLVALFGLPLKCLTQTQCFSHTPPFMSLYPYFHKYISVSSYL